MLVDTRHNCWWTVRGHCTQLLVDAGHNCWGTLCPTSTTNRVQCPPKTMSNCWGTLAMIVGGRRKAESPNIAGTFYLCFPSPSKVSHSSRCILHNINGCSMGTRIPPSECLSENQNILAHWPGPKTKMLVLNSPFSNLKKI